MLVGALVWIASAYAEEGAFIGQGTDTSASSTNADFYVIQAGDTLWDISTRFLGDPHQWPELWSYNEYITNPHWIYPGNRIYFRLGTQLDAPGVGLEEPTVAETPYQPTEQPRPVAENLCDFPARFAGNHNDIRVRAAGVLAEERDLNIRGKVYASEANGVNIGEPSLVYFKMSDDDSLECGQLLSVYRRQGRRLRGSAGNVGFVYRVLATARVIRVDGRTVTAQVRDSYYELERGDLVGDPAVVDYQIDVKPPSGDLEASLLARLTENQIYPGTGEAVFLDRGTNDGLEAGKSLYMVERRDGIADRDAKEDKHLPERVIGRIVVIHAGEGASTGIITDLAKEFSEDVRLVGTPNAD